MPYRDIRWSMLTSRHALETAMRAADVHNAELARRAEASASAISRLRYGITVQMRTNWAQRLEAALGLEPGALFQHPDPPSAPVEQSTQDKPTEPAPEPAAPPAYDNAAAYSTQIG